MGHATKMYELKKDVTPNSDRKAEGTLYLNYIQHKLELLFSITMILFALVRI